MKQAGVLRQGYFWLGVLIVLLLGGCAPAKPKLRFVWPPPPETPRLEWVGVYYSEMDFKKSGSKEMLSKWLGENGEYVFKTPFGIASDSKGLVYISDIHDHNVRVYDFNNKTVEFLTKQPVMKTPLGLEVDSKGNLYIADVALGKVLVYDRNKRPLFTFGENPEILKAPCYIAINEKLGRIYVSDSKKHQIVVFDLTGKHLFSFGSAGKEPGQLYGPQGLAIDAKDNVYVADTLNARIQAFDADGKYLFAFGERGDQPFQFEDPKDLAFDSEGNLHVLDTRRHSIYTYKPDGTLLLVTGEGKPTANEFGFSVPKSIFIDRNDRIYVAESLGRRFAVWQYMSKAYLQRHPWTEADKKALIDYMEQVRRESEKQK